MRRLIWLLTVVALLWCGWWWGATTTLTRQAAELLDGSGVRFGDLTASGFPLTLGFEARDVEVQDPARGVSLRADWVQASAPSHWPGHLTVRLPDSPIALDTPFGALSLHLDDAVGQLMLRPGLMLEFDAARVTTAGWQINAAQGNWAVGQNLLVSVERPEGAQARYDIELRGDGLEPGDLLRAALDIPTAWPRRFEALAAAITVSLSAPLDRSHLEAPMPDLRALNIRALDVQWGALRAQAEGTLSFETDGVPEGALSFVIANWRAAMAQAVRSGLITAEQSGQALLLLNALANMSGTPDDLDLTLRFETGQMFLGPIALGPAPRLNDF